MVRGNLNETMDTITLHYDKIRVRKSPAKRVLIFLIYLAGIIPFGFIISILSFYFHAANVLGYYPTWDHPDPKELSIYDSYHAIINPAAEIWLIDMVGWILLCVTLIIMTRHKIYWRTIMLSSIGHIIAVLILFSGILEWYAD